MKYGLVIYKETKNIGDDIQCYAAARLLGRVDVVLDREHLDDIDSQEPVAVVMNGWFLHRKWNWPPANCLRPHFVAFHYAEYRMAQYYGEYVKKDFLSGPGLEYLKAWGPIGCRDLNTVQMLKDMGVEAYFSGCMTLTLPQMPKAQPAKPYVCFVDVDPKAAEALSRQAQEEGVEPRMMTHLIPEYPAETSWEERARQVEKLLTVYQNASCVVTSRLHCALPCLALGTPVLLVRPDLDNIRFQPYVQWMHTATVKDARRGAVEYSFAQPPANSGLHMETRENLIRSVQKFAAEAENIPQKFDLPELERLRWQRDTMRHVLEESLENYKFDILKYERKCRELMRRETPQKPAKAKAENAEPAGPEEDSLWDKLYYNLKVNGVSVTLRKIKENIRK